MGLLFLNSIMMISFFLVGNIEKKLMVLHKLSEMDILKKNPNKTIVDFVVKLSSAHGKIVFRKTNSTAAKSTGETFHFPDSFSRLNHLNKMY